MFDNFEPQDFDRPIDNKFTRFILKERTRTSLHCFIYYVVMVSTTGLFTYSAYISNYMPLFYIFLGMLISNLLWVFIIFS